MCSNKILPKPPTPKPLTERLKKKFHRIDSQYQVNSTNLQLNGIDDNSSSSSSAGSVFSKTFLQFINSTSSPIHNPNNNNNKTKKTKKTKVPQLKYIYIYII